MHQNLISFLTFKSSLIVYMYIHHILLHTNTINTIRNNSLHVMARCRRNKNYLHEYLSFLYTLCWKTRSTWLKLAFKSVVPQFNIQWLLHDIVKAPHSSACHFHYFTIFFWVKLPMQVLKFILKIPIVWNPISRCNNCHFELTLYVFTLNWQNMNVKVNITIVNLRYHKIRL